MREANPDVVAFPLMERKTKTNSDGFLIQIAEKEVEDRPTLESGAERPIDGVSGIKVTDPNGSDVVKIVLGPFACDSIEERFGPHLGRGVQAALRHYARRVRSARRPPQVPLFMRDAELDRSTAIELDVAVPYEVQSALEREARLQLLPVDRIVAHAIFVYLSDVDTGGRLGTGVAEEVEATPRYTGRADQQMPHARRSRGMARPSGPLRRRGGAWGRSRFGRR